MSKKLDGTLSFTIKELYNNPKVSNIHLTYMFSLDGKANGSATIVSDSNFTDFVFLYPLSRLTICAVAVNTNGEILYEDQDICKIFITGIETINSGSFIIYFNSVLGLTDSFKIDMYSGKSYKQIIKDIVETLLFDENDVDWEDPKEFSLNEKPITPYYRGFKSGLECIKEISDKLGSQNGSKLYLYETIDARVSIKSYETAMKENVSIALYNHVENIDKIKNIVGAKLNVLGINFKNSISIEGLESKLASVWMMYEDPIATSKYLKLDIPLKIPGENKAIYNSSYMNLNGFKKFDSVLKSTPELEKDYGILTRGLEELCKMSCSTSLQINELSLKNFPSITSLAYFSGPNPYSPTNGTYMISRVVYKSTLRDGTINMDIEGIRSGLDSRPLNLPEGLLFGNKPAYIPGVLVS